MADMTTIADNLRDAAQNRGLTITCKITPNFHHLVRIDVGNITRVVNVATAARILSALRTGTGNPLEILRMTK